MKIYRTAKNKIWKTEQIKPQQNTIKNVFLIKVYLNSNTLDLIRFLSNLILG